MTAATLPARTDAVRIAVTGVGLVTPHGGSVAASWPALCRGERAARALTWEDVQLDWSRDAFLSGPWSGAPATGFVNRGDPRQPLDPVIELARSATCEALQQAGLDRLGPPPERVGCVIGTSKGGLAPFCRQRPAADSHQWNLWDQTPPSAAAAELTRAYGWQGPCLTPIAACATGLCAVIRAAALIRDGQCDVVIAGSSDASLLPSVLGSFRRLGVLASQSLPPGEACRPFDAHRAGFVVGEGAGMLVLERWDHALARRQSPLAEWIDGLQYSDPQGLTLLSPDPEPLARLIGDLLRRTGLTPRDLDAVSLHGTGTRINDAYEAQALARILGSDVDQVPGFGLKGGIGHLLGAAGSVEAVAAICALRDQRLPPTVNCEELAGDCPLPLTIGRSVVRPLRQVLKLSLGFGGHLAAGLLRRAD